MVYQDPRQRGDGLGPISICHWRRRRPQQIIGRTDGRRRPSPCFTPAPSCPSPAVPLPACVPLPPVVWKNMFVFGEKSKGAAADITRPRGRRRAAAAASPVAAAGGLTGDAKAGSKRRKYFDAFLLLPTFLLHLLTTLQTAATTCTSLPSSVYRSSGRCLSRFAMFFALPLLLLPHDRL